MKEARARKFSDPDWKQLIQQGSETGLIPEEFLHSFCKVITKEMAE
jgi:hypothetical protein